MDSSSTVSKSRNKLKSTKEKTIINEELEEAALGSILFMNLRNSGVEASPLSPHMNREKMAPLLGP
jgi:hypothetical protein